MLPWTFILEGGFFNLNWTIDGYTEKVTQEIVQRILDRKCWGDMNRVYAGLGQMLQEDPERLFELARKHATNDVNHYLEVMYHTLKVDGGMDPESVVIPFRKKPCVANDVAANDDAANDVANDVFGHNVP